MQDEAALIFSGTGVRLTEDGPDLVHKAGHHHLGAAVGMADFVAAYLNRKVAAWAAQVDCLTDVAAIPIHMLLTLFSSLAYGTDERSSSARCLPWVGIPTCNLCKTPFGGDLSQS